MPYIVTKTLTFCYGHRLLNYEGPCKNLHGHNAKVDIEIASKALNQKGMVLDFSQIRKKLKNWIDQNLDHRMILSRDDPKLAALRKLDSTVVALEANPTAENLASFIFKKAKELGLPVSAVTLWETESSKASYRET